jgi:hypothetical protein
MLFTAARETDEKGFIAVSRDLIHRITADAAKIQMKQDGQFRIQVQLIVEKLQQPAKIACAHDYLLLSF